MRALLAPVRLLVDAALPPRCPGCGAVSGADHLFCADCWGRLRWLGPPWCAACRHPLPIDHGVELCDRCSRAAPEHDGVRAAVSYDEIARAIVLRLKHGGHIAYAETVARHMARLVPRDADLLVPVPLHRWRLWRRGFNQAALIAQAVGRRRGVPVALDALRRVRATPMLRGLGRQARARAVGGAFALAARAEARLAGRHVLLVDDVFTTGATAAACARLLRQGGAATVEILCWARVLDPDADD